MLAHAQNLVYTLKQLMPTQYQKDNLEAMLALFLELIRKENLKRTESDIVQVIG